ncbi:S-phase kinase-associated protein 1-like isoform X1 [Drosophila albomicans]|uniref:S-phase kinase-associated protein 1-like isoform X1 n=2 Tax=Drosophila albomicans TaxID=7291 RepID=A0A6P8WD48_DROAB|nr:S-phase kinase-associated protein 1-like isoform X1 [Drosophila albomicans]
MPFIKLQTSDNVIFNIDLDLIMCSGTIKGMLQSCSGEDEVVPLPKVRSGILTKILEWAEFHRKEFSENTEEEDEESTDVVSKWDSEFIKVDQSILFELITVANFLNIDGLMQLACKTVANMIKEKTTEQIRTIFNIQNVLSNSEERVNELVENQK